jgi:hypothetical protein
VRAVATTAASVSLAWALVLHRRATGPTSDNAHRTAPAHEIPINQPPA